VVAWEDDRAHATDPKDWDIYVNSSTDGGATWRVAETRVDGAVAASRRRTEGRGGRGGQLYVAWETTGTRQGPVLRAQCGRRSELVDAGARERGVTPGQYPVDTWDLAADGTGGGDRLSDNRTAGGDRCAMCSWPARQDAG